MSEQHTPGPWEVFLVKDGPNKGDLLGIGENTGEGVADAYGGIWGSGGEKLANAHLIAAAPEMLEALEWVIDELEGRTRYDTPEQLDNCIKKVHSAIAKARGK